MSTLLISAISLSLDSLVASIAIGALPLRTVKRSALIAAFGISDGIAALIGGSIPVLSHWFLHQPEWVTLASVAAYAFYVLLFVRAARSEQHRVSARALYALPILFSLDNLLAGSVLLQHGSPLMGAFVLGCVSSAMAFLGILLGGSLKRVSFLRSPYIAAAVLLTGAVLQITLG